MDLADPVVDLCTPSHLFIFLVLLFCRLPLFEHSFELFEVGFAHGIEIRVRMRRAFELFKSSIVLDPVD